MSQKPQLNFTITSLTGDGFPIQNDEVYKTIIEQAISGGKGTAFYLQHMQKYADFASYLNKIGSSAYSYEDGPSGSQQALATDGQTTMRVNVQLSQDTDNMLYALEDGATPPPVHGVATVSLKLPSPEDVDKIVNLAIGLAEVPAGIATGKALMDVLFKPLVEKLSQFIQKSIENWAKIDLGEDVDAAGDAIADASSDAAADIGEEATEVVVEEVAADVLVDLSAAVPPLAVLGALVAIPMIVSALEKKFILHIEVNNLTEYDLQWSLAYTDEGTMTSQPKADYIPKMGRAKDIWGDETDIPVVYQANYSSMNKSGFTGIGFVLNLTPKGAEPGTNVAAVISIPWVDDNVIWLGDVPSSPDWKAIYEQGAASSSQLSVDHGNLKFFNQIAINALEGSQDEYYCVLKIEPL
jgi:hypothetical protein